VATAHRSRKVSAGQLEVWALIADPHHLPRWWPGVARVEGVADDRFTQVFTTKRGRPIRVDFRVRDSEPPWTCTWEQELAGTPFERVLSESTIVVRVEPVGDGSEVTLLHEQKLRGYSRTGRMMLGRATGKRLEEALKGLASLF
jgi:uncharacterized protein YndB with AHSA1/START domain